MGALPCLYLGCNALITQAFPTPVSLQKAPHDLQKARVSAAPLLSTGTATSASPRAAQDSITIATGIGVAVAPVATVATAAVIDPP